MSDTRVWRYRAGEARIFPSADAVPVGEGWVDSPAKVNSQPVPREDDGVVVPPRNRKQRRQQK